MLEIIRTVRLSRQFKGPLRVNICFTQGNTLLNVEVLDSTPTGFIVDNDGVLTLAVLANIETVEFVNV